MIHDREIGELVALTYRTRRQAGEGHRAACQAAQAIYGALHPEALVDEAERAVTRIIAGTLRERADWLWAGIREGEARRQVEAMP